MCVYIYMMEAWWSGLPEGLEACALGWPCAWVRPMACMKEYEEWGVRRSAEDEEETIRTGRPKAHRLVVAITPGRCEGALHR